MIYDLAYIDEPILIFHIIWHRTFNDKQLSMSAMRLMQDYLISTDNNKSHFRGRELWEHYFADGIKFDGLKSCWIIKCQERF